MTANLMMKRRFKKVNFRIQWIPKIYKDVFQN